jgi:hypothetical protein
MEKPFNFHFNNAPIHGALPTTVEQPAAAHFQPQQAPLVATGTDSLPIVSENSDHNDIPIPAPPKNITVEVSGSRFCIVPSLFQSIEKLHWKSSNGVLKLNSDPDVFEMILQYFLFSSLPDSNAMSAQMASELIELVSPLDQLAIQPLVRHVKSVIDGHAKTKKKNYRRGSSLLKRGISNLSSMSISSRNKSTSRDDQNNLKQELATPMPLSENKQTTVTSEINAVRDGLQPPVHLVTATATTGKIVSKDHETHESLRTSDSSSSDGSISKLSQPSFAGYSLVQDENQHHLSNFADVLKPPHFILNPTQYVVPNSLPPSDYPQDPEFDTVTRPIESSAFFSEMNYSFPQKNTFDDKLHHHHHQGMSSQDESGNERSGKKKPKGKGSLKTSKLIRKVFRSENNNIDRGQRKMTHADWCASEYVL